MKKKLWIIALVTAILFCFIACDDSGGGSGGGGGGTGGGGDGNSGGNTGTGGNPVTDDGNSTSASDFDFDETSGTITKYKGRESNVIIPSQINGKPVTAIGYHAFGTNEHNNNSITSITIPDSVTSIDEYSFYCASLNNVTWYYNPALLLLNSILRHSLRTVIIADSVTYIGNNFRYAKDIGNEFVQRHRKHLEGKFKPDQEIGGSGQCRLRGSILWTLRRNLS